MGRNCKKKHKKCSACKNKEIISNLLPTTAVKIEEEEVEKKKKPSIERNREPKAKEKDKWMIVPMPFGMN